MKKRMQGQVLEHMSTAFTSSPARYSGIIHCCQTIFRHEGLMGFYRGIMPTVTKSVLATAVTFSAYEVRTVLCIYRAIVTWIQLSCTHHACSACSRRRTFWLCGGWRGTKAARRPPCPDDGPVVT